MSTYPREKYFNVAGPSNANLNYMLPPTARFDMDEIMHLIHEQRYFILHAPRQTGKTTALLSLMHQLNAAGEYRALYANIEKGQALRENVSEAMKTIVASIAGDAYHWLEDKQAKPLAQQIINEQPSGEMLAAFIAQWCEQSDKPSVLMLDEVDALIGDTLISLLRQLRAGYTNRPRRFPQTIILCGVRDIKDYRIHSSSEKTIITGGSAFNIKTESLRLGDFTEADVYELLTQHTTATGQLFTPEALQRMWYYSQGQPWLVNALAYELTYRMKANRNRSVTLTSAMVDNAKENLILSRATHLDQLVDKLREPRVRRVVELLLAGEEQGDDLPSDDIQYTRDLGLIAANKPLRIANPIYSEIIPRELTWSTQETMLQETAWYKYPNGQLNMSALLTAFQAFFRENSEIWLERFDYKESGPQLLMQAFLQRVINGGGRITREYALGRRRTDLLVEFGEQQVAQRIVIELKVTRRRTLATVTAEGLQQTADYADKCNANEAHLIVFDTTSGKMWDDKIYQRDEVINGRTIKIWGC